MNEELPVTQKLVNKSDRALSPNSPKTLINTQTEGRVGPTLLTDHKLPGPAATRLNLAL